VNAQDTPAEPTPDFQLEISHLLLIDAAGYSKLLIDKQIELLHALNRIVRSTDCFRAAEASGHPSLALNQSSSSIILFCVRGWNALSVGTP